jgi:lactate dehydrogenase-like 2-hydroxyacid dehydrogenase
MENAHKAEKAHKSHSTHNTSRTDSMRETHHVVVITDVLNLEPDLDPAPFEKFGEVHVFSSIQPADLPRRIPNATILVVNRVPLCAGTLEKLPDLTLICVTGTGTNGVDLAYCASRGIIVSNVRSYCTGSVAQHTFAVLLTLVHRIERYNQYIRSGEFLKAPVFTTLAYPHWELDGERWGIVGMGDIGRRVAAIAGCFGAEVVYYSSSGQDRAPAYSRVSLEELAETSRVVSIHAPLNDQTRGLFDARLIRKMRRDAYLLNLGRGGILDEEALAAALDRGELAGAGLDVLEFEPPREDSPLLRLKNPEKLIITPHTAWVGTGARRRLIAEILSNIQSFTEGTPRNSVTL